MLGEAYCNSDGFTAKKVLNKILSTVDTVLPGSPIPNYQSWNVGYSDRCDCLEEKKERIVEILDNQNQVFYVYEELAKRNFKLVDLNIQNENNIQFIILFKD